MTRNELISALKGNFKIQELVCPHCYKQFNNEFQANLSIIDVLMFNSRDNVIKMLTEFTLIDEKAEIL